MAAELVVLALVVAVFGVAYYFFPEQLQVWFQLLESTKETGLSLAAMAIGLVLVASGATTFVILGVVLFLYGLSKLLFKQPYEEVVSWIRS